VSRGVCRGACVEGRVGPVTASGPVRVGAASRAAPAFTRHITHDTSHMTLHT
jgi:hypothetical protein